MRVSLAVSVESKIWTERAKRHYCKSRQSGGQQLAELAAVLVVLLLGFIIPVVNLAVAPVRWSLCQSFVDSDLRMLARCEKYSQALALHASDFKTRETLSKLCGVTLEDSRLYLTLRSKEHGSLEIDRPGNIPTAWLNDSIEFSLCHSATAKIAPFVTARPFGIKIDGINAPLSLQIATSTQWENTGRDPLTLNYFVNE